MAMATPRAERTELSLASPSVNLPTVARANLMLAPVSVDGLDGVLIIHKTNTLLQIFNASSGKVRERESERKGESASGVAQRALNI